MAEDSSCQHSQLLPNEQAHWLIGVVVTCGVMLSTLSASIVNVAMPTMVVALHTDLPTAQWISTGYYLMIICLLPLIGRAGDIWGTFRVFRAGFLVVLTGSVLCSIAPSVHALILARLVQALGAAMLVANSNSIIVQSVPAGQRGRMLGFVGSGASLGPLISPGLGGLILEWFPWNAVFYVIIPIAALGFWGARSIVPAKTARIDSAVDYLGAGLLGCGMLLLSIILGQGLQWSWTTLCSVGFFCSLIFFLFTLHEKRVAAPIIDFSLFRNRVFWSGNLSGMISWLIFGINAISLPFFLQSSGMPPSTMGFLMLVGPVCMMIIAPFSGRLSDQLGAQIPTVCGLVLMGLGSYYASHFHSQTSYLSIIVSQALFGVGNGAFQAPNNNSVMSSVVPTKLGMAGGINALARHLGLVAGTAASMAIIEQQRRAATAQWNDATSLMLGNPLIDGFQRVMLAAAIFSILGAMISYQRVQASIVSASSEPLQKSADS